LVISPAGRAPPSLGRRHFLLMSLTPAYDDQLASVSQRCLVPAGNTTNASNGYKPA
jgi:hypothetical protein